MTAQQTDRTGNDGHERTPFGIDTAAAHPLRNVARDYAWGSTTVIPELLGVEPTGGPVAELWMGAHPAAPSVLAEHPDLLDLNTLIRHDPDALLGRRVAQRFGRTLPFLLKVIAADQPLSLQAHPSLSQARSGFARENAEGIALDAPARNYKDANHKPEQIVALTAFAGLCGFRPVADTAAFLDRLDVAALAGYRSRLVAHGGLRDVVTALLTLPAPSILALLTDLVPAAERLAATDDRWATEAYWIAQLAGRHPGDRGVVIAMLLNLVRLAPGESMFLAAGQIHTYLEGTGVEILANSDNVLRGGLTSKHVDVPELMAVLDVTEQSVVPVAATEDRDGVWAYPSSVPDFVLHRLQPSDARIELPSGGPRILICTAGQASLRSGGAALHLRRGQSVFLPAGAVATLDAADGGATVFAAAANV